MEVCVCEREREREREREGGSARNLVIKNRRIIRVFASWRRIKVKNNELRSENLCLIVKNWAISGLFLSLF